MKKVLIVEDNEILRDNLNELLQYRGILTESASNGKEALHVLSENEPDLILSDLDMPELDGLGLLEQVRATEHLSKVPFILMTTNPNPSIPEKAFSLGARAFITKPFPMSELDPWLYQA